MYLLTERFAPEAGKNNITASMWFHIGTNTDQRIKLFLSTPTEEGPGDEKNGYIDFIFDKRIYLFFIIQKYKLLLQ